MKLNKTVTKEFFVSDDSFLKVEELWKDMVKDKGYVPSYAMLFYQLIRGKDFTKSFTNVTNPIKLNNGVTPDSGYRTAKWNLLNRCNLSKVRHRVDGNIEMIRQFDADPFLGRFRPYITPLFLENVKALLEQSE